MEHEGVVPLSLYTLEMSNLAECEDSTLQGVVALKPLYSRVYSSVQTQTQMSGSISVMLDLTNPMWIKTKL